jgi:hypothetical protein
VRTQSHAEPGAGQGKREALTTAETHAQALALGYRPPQPRKTVPSSPVAGVAEPVDIVIVA